MADSWSRRRVRKKESNWLWSVKSYTRKPFENANTLTMITRSKSRESPKAEKRDPIANCRSLCTVQTSQQYSQLTRDSIKRVVQKSKKQGSDLKQSIASIPRSQLDVAHDKLVTYTTQFALRWIIKVKSLTNSCVSMIK